MKKINFYFFVLIALCTPFSANTAQLAEIDIEESGNESSDFSDIEEFSPEELREQERQEKVLEELAKKTQKVLSTPEISSVDEGPELTPEELAELEEEFPIEVPSPSSETLSAEFSPEELEEQKRQEEVFEELVEQAQKELSTPEISSDDEGPEFTPEELAELEEEFAQPTNIRTAQNNSDELQWHLTEMNKIQKKLDTYKKKVETFPIGATTVTHQIIPILENAIEQSNREEEVDMTKIRNIASQVHDNFIFHLINLERLVMLKRQKVIPTVVEEPSAVEEKISIEEIQNKRKTKLKEIVRLANYLHRESTLRRDEFNETDQERLKDLSSEIQSISKKDPISDSDVMLIRDLITQAKTIYTFVRPGRQVIIPFIN